MRTWQKQCVATDTWRSLGCRTPLEHRSKRKPTVEPRWAKQQTKMFVTNYDYACCSRIAGITSGYWGDYYFLSAISFQPLWLNFQVWYLPTARSLRFCFKLRKASGVLLAGIQRRTDECQKNVIDFLNKDIKTHGKQTIHIYYTRPYMWNTFIHPYHSCEIQIALEEINSSVAKQVPLIMILWPLPWRYAGEIKKLSWWGDYEISAGGDEEASQWYFTYEGNLMIYNECTRYVTYG